MPSPLMVADKTSSFGLFWVCHGVDFLILALTKPQKLSLFRTQTSRK